MPDDKRAIKAIRDFVAVGRAGFERPHTPEGNPAAQRALVHGIEVQDANGMPLEVNGPLVELLVPRSLFFDQHVLQGLGSGVTQVVNVGAGYDDRALRFRKRGVKFFEIDLPHVIADKARRLDIIGDSGSGPILIPADLHIHDVANLLAAAGHDRDVPTIFIGEHVVLFVDAFDVRRLFTGLASAASAGSTLALTLETHPCGFDSDLVLSTVDDVMFDNDQVLRSIRTDEAWVAMLAASDWCVENPEQPNTVDHFAVPVSDQMVQIKTRFVTASKRRVL